MPRILHLTLKKKWFDMIASGEKKEEYRDIKPHWNRVFTNHWCKWKKSRGEGGMNAWDIVHFTNGYGKTKPQVELEFVNIRKGIGNPEWGAPKEEVYIIELGKILSIKNYTANEHNGVQ